MKKILLIWLLAWIPLIAQDAKVTPLMLKPLADIPGKEVEMIVVEYPPGGVDPVHRHNAHSLVYVLEGSVIMGVKGGKSVTLTAGQTFYEGPDDIHTVGRNASKTTPAKFIVFLLKEKAVNGIVEIAGPEKIRLDELVRRFLSAVGDSREVAADRDALYSGARLSERTIVPEDDATLGETRFGDWLAQQSRKSRSPAYTERVRKAKE